MTGELMTPGAMVGEERLGYARIIGGDPCRHWQAVGRGPPGCEKRVPVVALWHAPSPGGPSSSTARAQMAGSPRSGGTGRGRRASSPCSGRFRARVPLAGFPPTHRRQGGEMRTAAVAVPAALLAVPPVGGSSGDRGWSRAVRFVRGVTRTRAAGVDGWRIAEGVRCRGAVAYDAGSGLSLRRGGLCPVAPTPRRHRVRPAGLPCRRSRRAASAPPRAEGGLGRGLDDDWAAHSGTGGRSRRRENA